MPVPGVGAVYVDVHAFDRDSERMSVSFLTNPPRFMPSSFVEILPRRWMARSDYGALSYGERTQLIEEIKKWNAVHDPIIKPAATIPATAKLPLCGCVHLPVIRDGETFRLPRTLEPPHGTLDVCFFTDISGHNAGDYIKIADDIWVSNSYPIAPSLLPHVLAEIEKWKVEHSPKIENKPPAYSGENKGSPDALIAWLRRDKSALATDAADEIERLRGWLLHMQGRAARNSWHIYSSIAYDALTGKPVPEMKGNV